MVNQNRAGRSARRGPSGQPQVEPDLTDSQMR